MKMLEAKNIHKSYNHAAKALHVLKGINLAVNEGDMISIIGPSGAGKSTLLHVLGGLDKPDSGEVILDRQDLYRLKENKLADLRNKSIGFIFQFYHLLPEFSALENVIMPAIVKHGSKKIRDFEKKGMDLLSQVGLVQRALHRPSQLSGGEQQRVAIARALVNEPKIIFCDEPTGNLDSQSGKDIIEVLKQLNKKNKQTVVIVTHDDEIANVSHKRIQMRDGNLLK